MVDCFDTVIGLHGRCKSIAGCATRSEAVYDCTEWRLRSGVVLRLKQISLGAIYFGAKAADLSPCYAESGSV